ncbi:sensor histidine kinase [Sphingomonas sp. MMS24-J45]|uniref:sensor histidine kinase n=1 Tax=Sphingomonas sp. MMS24-J45 TaxID=3238806 RepID=UPI003851184C
MPRRSLRGIALIYVAAILVALLVLRGATYSIAHHALGIEVDRRLALEADEITRAGSLPRVIAAIDREQRDHDSADLFFAVFDATGRQVSGTLKLRQVPPLGFSDFDERAGVPGVGHGRILTRRLANGTTLSVISDNDDIDAFDALMFRVQLIGLFLTMLIVAGGTAGMIWEISRRLRSMQRTVDAVMAGDFHRRIPQTGSGSEFDQQAAAFNAMLDRIGTLMNDIRHAAKDVAHELKSPLARLRNRLAAIERRSTGTALAPEIADALDETDQLLDLFASLLRLWEIEGGHRRERFEPLDLAVLAQETYDALTPVAEDSGHRLILRGARSVPLRGERNLLRQLLVNLIENSIRHTPSGTEIELSVVSSPTGARLIVTDRGPGIPPDQHAQVIRRFGRLESSVEAPGHGIGLTLVDAIVRLHGGTLALADAAPGLRVVIEMPRDV